MTRLLVIDDEPGIQHSFRRAFGAPEFQVETTGRADLGLKLMRSYAPDVVILDVKLPDATGLQVLPALRQIDARVPVIVITGHGTTDTAIEAMKLGAFDYVLKPLELETIRQIVKRAAAVGLQMRVPTVLDDGAEPALKINPDCETILGRCAAMQEVYKTIGRVAATDVAVLIQGESGTGKELVARAIYQHSHRAKSTYLPINCAAIPESLLESELFGHEKGSFTDADRMKIGKFEQCHGGTLFLDEVGDMPPSMQVKILRVLQERQLERVGATQTISVDVRLIAATHYDLKRRVAEGLFRHDLYYRLGVLTIELPPLRQRGEDLPMLAQHLVERYSRELHRDVRSIAPETMSLLMSYRWPGNIRELQSVIKQALIKATGYVLLAEYLPAAIRDPDGLAGGASNATENAFVDFDGYITERIAAGSTTIHEECLQFMERRLFTAMLKHTRGNLTQSARLLGIHRRTLRLKLHGFGLASPPDDELQ
ncbi:MAG: glnG 1 [Planctomycetaceae bacterium]|nr:glnG 1 [Planctomycetaceae bacterium]